MERFGNMWDTHPDSLKQKQLWLPFKHYQATLASEKPLLSGTFRVKSTQEHYTLYNNYLVITQVQRERGMQKGVVMDLQFVKMDSKHEMGRHQLVLSKHGQRFTLEMKSAKKFEVW